MTDEPVLFFLMFISAAAFAVGIVGIVGTLVMFLKGLFSKALGEVSDSS